MAMKTLHVVVAGAGNTGSHLLPHLARISEITRITVADPDLYEDADNNIAAQNIDRGDLGRPKAAVQGEKLRRIRPDLEVAAFESRIEDVPRGLLRCDLFLSCVDTKLARQHLNDIAWRLNTPWVDLGVLGSQNLARVSTHRPAQDAPCLECSWDPGPQGEYALLHQDYLCGAGGVRHPSMASSALGALAASFAAIEIAKFLRGDSFGGSELIVDAEHRAVQVTVERRNPWCRFDHHIWHIEPWVCRVDSTTVGDALRALGCLRVEGHRFVHGLVCPGCGRRSDETLRMNRPAARCSSCDRRMTAAEFGFLDHLDPANAADFSKLTLSEIGFRCGDIVSSYGRHRILQEAA